MRGASFDVLQCAAIGHHWESGTSIHRTLTSHTLLLRCTSCGTERVDDLERDGSVTYRKYEQSDQYRAFREEYGGESKTAYRGELMKRVRKMRAELKKEGAR